MIIPFNLSCSGLWNTSLYTGILETVCVCVCPVHLCLFYMSCIWLRFNWAIHVTDIWTAYSWVPDTGFSAQRSDLQCEWCERAAQMVSFNVCVGICIHLKFVIICEYVVLVQLTLQIINMSRSEYGHWPSSIWVVCVCDDDACWWQPFKTHLNCTFHFLLF